MQSINLDELKKQAIATEPNNTNVTSLNLDDIKMIEENLQALFAENVNEIYMKTKWTRDETQKGYPTIDFKNNHGLLKDIYATNKRPHRPHYCI